MHSEIKYKYIENGRILVKEFRGFITVEAILKSWDGLIQEGKLDAQIIGVITDFRPGVRHIEVAELPRISAFYKEYENIFSNVKLAQIVDSPNISLPMLFEKNNTYLRSKSFSSFDAARVWILDETD